MTADAVGRKAVGTSEREGSGAAPHRLLLSAGKRSLLSDVAIPESLAADEIEQYLDNLFHEHASARHPDVRRLTDL
jgi:hypothetical protein